MGVTVNHVEPQARTVSTPKEELNLNMNRAQVQGADKAGSAAGAFAVDFGNEGTGAGAYASKKSAVTQMTGLSGEKDLTASRNMDIVLAHTLSPEDYRKAQEDGYHPAELEAGESATIVDHIKASLIQAGVSVSGVTDTLSREELTAITGSEALAGEIVRSFRENDIPLTEDNIRGVQDAVTRAETLAPLSDETVWYMVENGVTPSVDGLYLAAHSAKGRAQGANGFFDDGNGYFGKAEGTADMTALQGQIDDVVRRAGFDISDRQIQDEAKGLIGAGVTLTPEHLKAASGLRALRLPPEPETVVQAAAAAIARGRDAAQGSLTDPRSILEQAEEINRETKEITDEGIRLAIAKQTQDAEDQPLTLRNLIDATKEAGNAVAEQEAAIPAQNEVSRADAPQDARFMQERLRLEEVRLSMSVSVNMTMLRSGFAIDTSPMTALIDRLNKALAQNAEALFGGIHATRMSGGAALLSVSAEATVSAEMTQSDAVSRYRLYTETNLKVEYMRTEMPVGVIGALRDAFKTDTLDDIFTGARTWKVANDAYESMQTEVRRDLGDSIKKAFGNAEALLKDTGLKPTEDNLRAVRILGYNRMEITRQNVADVASWDAKLNAVLEDLKPAAVLDLIRDGKNPLKMTLDELAGEMHTRAAQTDPASDDKYARFLYKLEQAGQITEAERTSYIGIYRMFETLQRTDHAAIGTLLNTGADMSVRNLLTATRTMRTADGKGIDVRAAESFAGYEKSGVTNWIDTQIEEAFRYYSAKADTAFEHLAPEKLAQMNDPEGTLLPAFAEQMETLPADDAADAAYDAEQMLRIREALRENDSAGNKTTADISRDAAESALREAELSVSTANLEAYQALQNSGRRDGGSLWDRLKTTGKNTRTNAIIKGETDRLASALDSEEDYADIYERSTEAMQEAVKEQMISNDTSYVDFRALSILHRQLSVTNRMAERRNFEIPVETASGTVSMHVTLREDAGQGSAVRISMDTAEYGTVSANLSVRETAVSGMIATTFGETPQVKAFMDGLRDKLSRGIAGNIAGLSMDPAQTALAFGTGVPAGNTEGAPARGAGARTLFRIAKAFTEAVAI